MKTIGSFTFALVIFSFAAMTTPKAVAQEGQDSAGIEFNARVSHKKPVAPSAPSPSVGGGGGITDHCFSPKEGCDKKLIAFIDSARSTLDIAIYSITHAGIAKAIEDAQSRGVTVRMVVDRSQSKGAHSATPELLSSGVNLKIGNFKGIMHDKFTIVDGAAMETGSYNYTANATDNNAENQLYVNDGSVIQAYQGNFETMWSNALAP